MQCLLRESCSHKRTNQQRKMIMLTGCCVPCTKACSYTALDKGVLVTNLNTTTDIHVAVGVTGVCVSEWVSVQERECMWKRKPNIARRFSLEPSQVHVCLFHVTNRNKFMTNSHKNKPKLKCQQQTHSSNSPFSKTYKLQKYEKSKETAHSHWESGKKKKKFVLYIYVPTISKGHQFLMKNCYALVLLCKCSTWPGLCEISHMQSWTEIDDAVMTLLTKASVRLE